MKPLEIRHIHLKTPRWEVVEEVTRGGWHDVSHHPDPVVSLEMMYVSTRSYHLWNMDYPRYKWRAQTGGEIEVSVRFNHPKDAVVSYHTTPGHAFINPLDGKLDALADLRARAEIFSVAYGSYCSIRSMKGYLMAHSYLDIPTFPKELPPSARKNLTSLILGFFEDFEDFNLWGKFDHTDDEICVTSYLTRKSSPHAREHIGWQHGKEAYMLAWVLDLCVQYMRSEQKPVKASKMTGIVFLDTFDLYCHDQAESIALRDKIRACFPKLQFIVTSRYGK